MKLKLSITNCTATSALGRGIAAHRDALRDERSGLSRCDFEQVTLDTWIGRVKDLENEPIDGELAKYDCRNNRLALAGLRQDTFMESVATVVERYGNKRIGVFLGTSTAGVQNTEMAYTRKDPQGELPKDYVFQTTQNMYSISDYVRRALALEGPAQVVSTACSSSAKVFATAYRHIQAGLCDAAVVGGVDSLCGMTLHGFNALQLISSQPCRPADQNRDGINIGEAAGFALLERADGDTELQLLGYGECSDAYHMSSPHPEGKGAYLAMQQALNMAGLQPGQIDYVNLHGTATPANDISEDKAVYRLFNDNVSCSSTKGFTGHTLGTAGILEVVFATIAINEGMIPISLNTQTLDTQLRAKIVMQTEYREVNRVMSNSFGFGGNNASLVIGRSL